MPVQGPSTGVELHELATYIWGVSRRLIKNAGPVFVWAFTAVFFGLITGLVSVLLPLTGTLGIVAIAALVLLWAMPDLPAVPSQIIRKAFLVMLVVYLCVPFYYTVQISNLPWISVRRIATAALILPLAVTISGSSSARRQIAVRARSSLPIVFCASGFLATIIISIFTSTDFSASLSATIDAILSWYIPLVAVIYAIRSYEELLIILRVICVCAVLVAVAGVIEFTVQHRFLFDIFPKSMLASLMDQNPSIAEMFKSSPFRNGFYRASSIFTVSLSFAEFEVMMLPFGLFFTLHGDGWRDRLLGIGVTLWGLAAIFTTGARGGYVSLIAATTAFALLWILRKAKFNKSSLVPAIVAIMGVLGFMLAIGLIALWPRAHAIVLGGGAEAASTDARFTQWTLALPQIIANPITGHGFSLGAEAIGFRFVSGNGFTIDSYVLSLLVETGVPGFLFFTGMVAWAIWHGAQRYLAGPSRQSALNGAFACGFLAFGVYRLVLSLRENHMLFFTMAGMLVVFNYIEHAETVECQAQRREVDNIGP